MIGRVLLEDLRAGQLLVPDFLAQVEARFIQHEPLILAFIPDEKRFDRLYDEAEALVLSYPDLINRPLMFGALLGVKDIFYVEGFRTQAGSRLPSDVFQGTEARSVFRKDRHD
jgi:Asp-tRNA(Asn)/Glu-tRNA(Gln) amidotransferase A subunit family amidase